MGNVAALLGSLNVLLLIVANMIGFATAAGGTEAILLALASGEGFMLLCCAMVMLYNGVIVMLEIRAAEALQRSARQAASRGRGLSAQCENIYRGIGNLGDLLGSEAERHTHPITRVGKIYPAWPLARLYAATGRRRPSFCPRAARGGGPPR